MLLALVAEISSCFEWVIVGELVVSKAALVLKSDGDFPDKLSMQVVLVMSDPDSVEAGDDDDPSSSSKDEITGSESTRSGESMVGMS
jgi:hypothetical protein